MFHPMIAGVTIPGMGIIALMFAPFLDRNESNRPRRAIILNYMVDGTRSNAEDGNLMPGFKPVPKGQPISGAMFPLVLDIDALAP